MSEKEMSYDIYSAMQEGLPYKSYKKVIVGKVLVRVLNPFSDRMEEFLLYGNPYTDKELDNFIVDVWDVRGDQFFKRANSQLLKSGALIEFDRSKVKKEVNETDKYNKISDEEIEEILRKPFFTMTGALGKITQEATVVRFLNIAKKIGKSDAYQAAIEEKLAELQLTQYEE